MKGKRYSVQTDFTPALIATVLMILVKAFGIWDIPWLATFTPLLMLPVFLILLLTSLFVLSFYFNIKVTHFDEGDL